MNAAYELARLAMYEGMVVFPVTVKMTRKLDGSSEKTPVWPYTCPQWSKYEPNGTTLNEIEKAYGYGIDCGRSNIVVVDLDNHGNGTNGMELWGERGYPQSSYVVSTQSDSRHLYFKADPDRPLSNMSLRTLGVDVRSTGGFVFGPGTDVISGGSYKVIQDSGPLPMVPAELLEALREEDKANKQAVKVTVSAPITTATTGGTRIERYTRRYLERLASLQFEASQPAGAFNTTLNDLDVAAGELFGELHKIHGYKGHTIEDAQEFVRQAMINTPGIQPPDFKDMGTINGTGVATGWNDALRLPLEFVGNPSLLPQMGATAPVETSEETVDQRVLFELTKLRAQDQARRMFRAEQLGDQGVPPEPKTLTELLSQPRQPLSYRVEGLWPSGTRIMLTAQFKAGKTTMVGNVVRCLVDGKPFLDQYAINETARVGILDTEMNEDMFIDWLEAQGIENTDNVIPYLLKGKVSTLNILDPITRSEWATRLRALNLDILILDCLRPVMDALGLSEDKDGGVITLAFDELLKEAGIGEAMVVHHMGHSGERLRGDSRLRDWPDVEWRIVRPNVDNPASTRYFIAYGRNVNIPEAELGINTINNHMVVVGGNRQETKTREILPDLLEFVREHDGLVTGAVEDALIMKKKDGGKYGYSQAAFRSALKKAKDDRLIFTTFGTGTAKHLHISNNEPLFRSNEPPTSQSTRSQG